MTSRRYAAYVGILEIDLYHEQDTASSSPNPPEAVNHEPSIRFIPASNSPTKTETSNTHSTITVHLSNYLRLRETSGTSRTSASPNPPATSSHNSTNQSQRSSDSAQYNGKGQHHGHANSSNKEHQPQTITFTGHAERNDHREEAQRVAADASNTPSTPDPNHQNSSPQNISGSATWEPLQIR